MKRYAAFVMIALAAAGCTNPRFASSPQTELRWSALDRDERRHRHWPVWEDRGVRRKASAFVTFQADSMPIPGSLSVDEASVRYLKVLRNGRHFQITFGLVAEESHSWPGRLRLIAKGIPPTIIEKEDEALGNFAVYKIPEQEIVDDTKRFTVNDIRWNFETGARAESKTDFEFRDDLYRSGRWTGSLFGSVVAKNGPSALLDKQASKSR